jgi:hypothetical protein
MGSRRRMKPGLWAEGRSEGGNISSGRTAVHDVRESGDISSPGASRRVGILMQ